jgi:hypothetical protein
MRYLDMRARVTAIQVAVGCQLLGAQSFGQTCEPAAPVPGEARICTDCSLGPSSLDSDGDGFYTANDFLTFYYGSLPCNAHLDWSNDESTAANIVSIYNLYVEHYADQWNFGLNSYQILGLDGGIPDFGICSENNMPGGLHPDPDPVNYNLSCTFYGDCGIHLVMLTEVGRLARIDEITPSIYEEDPENPLCEDEGSDEGIFPLICSGSDCGLVFSPPLLDESPDIIICSSADSCDNTPIEEIVILPFVETEELEVESPSIPCDMPVSMAVPRHRTASRVGARRRVATARMTKVKPRIRRKQF